jgi:phosphopantetheinyl transferase
MTVADSGWTCDLFAAGVRDWTPARARHAAHVLFAPVARDPEMARRCASVLSDAERERAGRFVTEEGKAHFEQRRAFRRYCAARALGSRRELSEIVFAETEEGRPYLPEFPDLWFSFSSCRLGFLGAWSATHAIGVDIEDQTRKLEALALARRYFSKTEAEALEALEGLALRRAFFRLWCLKEAAMKSIGEGLPVGLDAFEFALEGVVRIMRVPAGHGEAGRFQAHVIGGRDDCAALVVRSVA